MPEAPQVHTYPDELRITPEVDGTYGLYYSGDRGVGPLMRCFPDRGYAVQFFTLDADTDPSTYSWLMSRALSLVECAKISEKANANPARPSTRRPMRTSPPVGVAATVPQHVWDAIRALCGKHNLGRNDFVTAALQNHLQAEAARLA